MWCIDEITVSSTYRVKYYSVIITCVLNKNIEKVKVILLGFKFIHLGIILNIMRKWWWVILNIHKYLKPSNSSKNWATLYSLFYKIDRKNQGLGQPK